MTDTGKVLHPEPPDVHAVAKGAFREDPRRPGIVFRNPGALPENAARHRSAPAGPGITVAQPAQELRTVIIAPPPAKPIPPPEGTNPRQVLAEALSEKTAADAAILAARAALDRADREVAAAEAALERAGEAEASDVAEAGQRLAVWLQSGQGERPGTVAGAGSARASAEAQLAAARAARQALAGEVDQAEGEVNRVELQIIGSIERLLVDAAVDDANRLSALLAAAASLSTRLVGVTALTWSLPGRVTRPIALPRPVLDVVRNSGATATTAARSVWEAFASRLRDDPTAELVVDDGDPPPPQAA